MPDVIITGPEGRLEGRYQHGKGEKPPIAIILHPHPQHGGTMNNKVVYALYHVYVKLGYSVLRFNFRGVGRSQGEYDRGEGELSDAASALDWLQQHNPDAPACWVAGFSFGAWIGMQLLMRRPEVFGFISVAPPANMFDFSFLAPCPSSGLMINGSADELVPTDSIAKLVKKLSAQRDITITHQITPGANHFFTNHMDALTEAVRDYVVTSMAAAEEKAA